MKLLLDQHLSRKLVALLQEAFPGTTHVVNEGLDQSDDESIWSFAATHGFVVVTKDQDFQLMSFSRGHPPKVIWIRLGNGPSTDVLRALIANRQRIDRFAADLDVSLLALP